MFKVNQSYIYFTVVLLYFPYLLDGIQMNPGLAALWEEEIERRKIKNINLENIHPPASPPRSRAVPTSSHDFYKTNLSKQLRECASEAVTSIQNQMQIRLKIENYFRLSQL
jgi:hypothetical protein